MTLSRLIQFIVFLSSLRNIYEIYSSKLQIASVHHDDKNKDDYS